MQGVQCQARRGSVPAVQLECFVSEGGKEGVVVVREGGEVDRHTLAGQALHQLTCARLPQLGLQTMRERVSEITDNFCIALFFGVHKLAVLYNRVKP